MKKKVRTYEAEDVVVEYDATRCIHVGECVRGLPIVFDPERRPWVAPGLASADAVADVVRRCPTGALHYRRPAGEAEQPASRNEVRVTADGPLYGQGRLDLRLPDGQVVEETRVALCRCGASENKPYCDNAHVKAGFRDAATDIPQQVGEGAAETATVAVAFASNGPILIDGPVAVCGGDASEASGAKAALCRCGQSASKPFCDGAHVASRFRAD